MPPEQIPPQPSIVVPPAPEPNHHLAYLLFGSLIFLIIIAAGGVVVWKMGLIKPNSSPVASTSTAPDVAPAKIYSAEELNKLMPVAAAEYERLLSDLKPKFILDNDDLSVILPSVPNLVHPDPSESNLLLVATSAQDWSGKDYPRDPAAKEGDIWSRAEAAVSADLEIVGKNPFFLHQLKGLTGVQVASVTGKLVLKLPVDIQELAFRSDEASTTKMANGVSVSLLSLQVDPVDKSKVQIKYTLTGDENLILDRHLVSGETPVGHFSSRMGNGEIEENYVLQSGEATTSLGFKFYVANSWERREYPFTVNNSQPKPLADGSSPGAVGTEKDQVIAAILNRQTVLASQDVAKIKALLVKSVPADQLAEFNQGSDEDILGLAAMMSVFAVTEAQLRSPTTVWQMSQSEATATIVEGSSKTSVNSVKVNGVWY